MTTRSASLYLPYFKQGDDMHNSIIEDENGNTDIKETFNNHINLLKQSIEILEAVKNSLLAENKEFKIDADTHMIMVTGPKNTIIQLEEDGVLSKDFCSDMECEDNEGDEGDDDIPDIVSDNGVVYEQSKSDDSDYNNDDVN
jgi:hypothetical protein